MITSGLVLFLFGTVVSAGPFIPTPTEIVISKNRHSLENHITEYYPSSGQQKGSPFISNFIQSGTNVFFKPQFMLAAAQMPPQVQAIIATIEKDDCKTSLPLGPVPVIPLIEEPLRIVEKEIYTSPEIKEVIEINSADLPQPIALPGAPLIVEEPCLTGEVEQIIIPEAPVLPAYIPRIEVPMPSVTTVMEIEQSRVPIVIPPAPELPPMEFLPRVPTMVEEVLVSKDVPAPEVIIEVEQPKQSSLPVLPPAPILPPMEMPNLPLVLEEITTPIEVIQEIPVFTSFIPETYVRDVVVEEKPAIEPVHAMMIIPEAPVLPPFEMPKLSVLVEEAKVIPCPPSEETHEITSVPIQPMIIPEAPVLPPYVPLELPAAVVFEEPRLEIVRPVELPRTSVLQPIELPNTSVVLVNSPEPCDTVEIIEEHVRPMVIPEAPALPPYVPLEIPTRVIVKEPIYEMEQEMKTPPPAPVLEPFELPKASVVVVAAPEPCETVEIVEDHVRPMVIPEAPVLPPYKALEILAPFIVKEPFFEVEKEIVRPVMPMEPIVVVDSPEPCDTIEIVEKHVGPMEIPKAPLLPPYNHNIHFEKEIRPAYASILPPMEILVERAAEVVAPCPPGQEDNYQRVVVEPMPVMPFAYPELSLTKPVVLPSAQNIPEYLLPYFSMLNKNVIEDKSIIVENNSLLAIPKDCAHDLVVEHISPNMGWK